MRLRIGIAVLMVATAISAYGQAAPACGPDSVTAFNTERREPFSGVLTTIPPNPNFSQAVLQELESGALEIREKLVYQRQGREKVISLITFLIESDLPFPTSDQELEEYGTIVEKATLGIKHILTSCSPLPSLMFVGTVTQQSFPQPGDAIYPGGWGVDITGATFALSTGYTSQSNPNPPGSSNCANPYPKQPKLFNVTESVAGVGVAWAPCAVGTLTLGPDEHNRSRPPF